MYLQLAEDEQEQELYIPVQTNQGTIYVKNPSLSAGGRGLQVFGKILSTAGKFIPIPGVNVAAGIVGNIATKAGQAKAGGGNAFQTASGMIPQGAGQKIGGFFAKMKARRDARKAGAAGAETATTDSSAARSAAPEVMETPPTFFQKYKTPLLIGGGLLVAGTAAALILKKRKRR